MSTESAKNKSVVSLARSKEVARISVQIESAMRDAVQAQAERAGCSTDALLRVEIARFIDAEAQEHQGARRVEPDGETCLFSIRLPPELKARFASKAKACNMTTTIAVRGVIRNILQRG